MPRMSKADKEFFKKTGFRNSVEFARYIREELSAEMERKMAKHKKNS